MNIFRKPLHTDHYLSFLSNHPLEHKASVVHTLFHRAETVITEEEDKNTELKHIKSALKHCGYPDWTFHNPSRPREPQDRVSNQQRTSRRPPVTIPYLKGLSYALRRTFDQHGVKTFFKPYNTIRQILGSPKYRLDPFDTCGSVYFIQCEGNNETECHHSYVGETERSLRVRVAEHLRPSSSNSEVSRHIYKDSSTHTVEQDNVKILARENKWFERGIR